MSKTSNLCRKLLCVVLLLASNISVVFAGDAANWTRGLLHGYVEDPLAEGPFVMFTISSLNGHLYGTGGYVKATGSQSTKIKGVRAADGDFWPFVVAQISDSLDGKWRTIGQGIKPGKNSVVTIPPGPNEINLYVDLNIFRPFLGKVVYGRVVLGNGDAAAFTISSLSPPKQHRSTELGWKGNENK